MRIRTFATIPEALAQDDVFTGAFVAVIDTLRATSVMTTALQNGARRIIPLLSPEQAMEHARQLPSGEYLLCGERGAVRIEGFDLGNSPLEFTPRRVHGKTLLMTTTNGTRAIHAAQRGAVLAIACMNNAPAVAALARASGLDVTLLCAGTHDRFSMEDVLTAGAIAQALPGERDDLSIAAAALFDAGRADLYGALQAYEHAGRLHALGFEADVRHCMRMGTHTCVPIWRAGSVTL